MNESVRELTSKAAQFADQAAKTRDPVTVGLAQAYAALALVESNKELARMVRASGDKMTDHEESLGNLTKALRARG